MSERCEQTSEQTSEWPSTYVPLLDYFDPLCTPERDGCSALGRMEEQTGGWNDAEGGDNEVGKRKREIYIIVTHRFDRMCSGWKSNDGKQCTVVQNNHESKRKYWATRSSVLSFVRTAHSYSCSVLFASLARSAELTCLFTRSLALSWESGWLFLLFLSVLDHSASGKMHSYPFR